MGPTRQRTSPVGFRWTTCGCTCAQGWGFPVSSRGEIVYRSLNVGTMFTVFDAVSGTPSRSTHESVKIVRPVIGADTLLAPVSPVQVSAPALFVTEHTLMCAVFHDTLTVAPCTTRSGCTVRSRMLPEQLPPVTAIPSEQVQEPLPSNTEPTGHATATHRVPFHVSPIEH